MGTIFLAHSQMNVRLTSHFGVLYDAISLGFVTHLRTFHRRVIPGNREQPTCLHFVAAQVFVVQPFQPLAQVFRVRVVRLTCRI